MEIKLLPFDSELWEEYRGAYGNVCEEVKILMGDIKDIPTQYKLRRLDFDEKMIIKSLLITFAKISGTK